MEPVAEKILLYNKAGGKVLAGLTDLRKEEIELFLNKVSNSMPSIKNDTKVENTAFEVKVTIDSLIIRDSPNHQCNCLDSIRDWCVYTIVKYKGAGGVY